MVKTEFQGYFIKKHNTIFERAKFNMRTQLDGEGIDSFATALHGLEDYCNFRELKEELIRDRVVIDLRDAAIALDYNSELLTTRVYYLKLDSISDS